MLSGPSLQQHKLPGEQGLGAWPQVGAHLLLPGLPGWGQEET